MKKIETFISKVYLIFIPAYLISLFKIEYANEKLKRR